MEDRIEQLEKCVATLQQTVLAMTFAISVLNGDEDTKRLVPSENDIAQLRSAMNGIIEQDGETIQ